MRWREFRKEQLSRELQATALDASLWVSFAVKLYKVRKNGGERSDKAAKVVSLTLEKQGLGPLEAAFAASMARAYIEGRP